jgi:hypothetical protein
MGDNEKVQHPSSPIELAWAVLDYQHLKRMESMIPKDQKNITTREVRDIFTAATQHLTLAVVQFKNLES